MARQWYYNDGNQTIGPVGDKELRDLARSQRITASTLVTTEGAKSWIEAGKIDGLFPKESALPPLVVPSVTLPPLPAVNQLTASVAGQHLQASTNSHSRRSSPSNVVVLAVCGTIGLCAIAAIAYAFVGRDSSRASITPPKFDKATGDGHRKTASGNRDARDSESDLLEKEKKILKDQVDELKRDKDKLQQEIKDLSAKVESRRKWRSIDFALINPTHYAVGMLATPDGTFKVVTKSEGKDAEDAVRIATTAKIPRIGNDRQLTRRVFDETTPGALVSDVLAKEIQSKCWKPHRYCPYDPDVVPQFMVYTDLAKGKQRIGFFESETSDTIKFQGLSPHVETVRREVIQPGSAKKIEGEDVLDVIGDMDLLDYCVFNIAQRVGMKPGEVGHRDLSVQVRLDVLEELEKHSKQTDERAVDGFFEFFSRVFGTQFKGDKRKEGVRMLLDAQKSLENEAYFKLTKMGLPVVERERIDLITEERNRAGNNGFAGKFGKLECASHIVLLEISKSGDAQYALNVRLLDVDNGRVVWAMMGDRTNRNGKQSQKQVNQFQLPSGRLCIVTPKPKTPAKDFLAFEEPPVLAAILSKRNSDVKSHVVMVESSVESENVHYRPLFGKQKLVIPRKSLESVEFPRDVNEIPKLHPELLRCVVWRLAKGIVPPAGRIEQTENGKIVVGVGRSAGVVPETKFRVVRAVGSSLSSQDNFLPIELVIAQLRAEDCDAIRMRDSSLVGSSTSTTDDSLNGALAVAQAPLTCIVVQPLEFIQPNRKIAKDLYTSVSRQQLLTQKAYQASIQVQEKIVAAFRQLGIPVETANNQQVVQNVNTRTPLPPPAPRPQGSHYVGGTISLAADSRFHLNIGFKHRENGPVIEHFEFDLSEQQL